MLAQRLTVQSLVTEFDLLHQALMNFVNHCPADRWEKITEAEGWRVGVTAHHIGAIHYTVVDQVQLLLDDRPLTINTLADIDRLNDAHVKEYADCTAEETSAYLAAQAQRVKAWFETLTGSDLVKSAEIEFMGGRTSAARLLEVVLLDLANGHLQSVTRT